MRVVLASGSPRRREILARITYPFEVRPADLDESRRDGEAPRDYVSRLAAEKAMAIARQNRDAIVLGADTTVALGDEILGKPVDARDAARMLGRLSGARHRVLSAVAIACRGEIARSFVTASDVVFRPIGAAEIEAYAATKEPLDKAGGYAVQGGAGKFVRGVEGSVTGVIGLPLEETREAMRGLGVREAEGLLSAEGIALRLRAVSGEIAARAVTCGRAPDTVRLVTVTKGHPPAGLAAVLEAGGSDVGENYVQEARDKRAVLGAGGARWHLIGPLQRNKAGVAAEVFDCVHTVDRPEIAVGLGRRRDANRPPLDVLLQVNVARDPAKSGVLPDAVAPLLQEVSTCERVRVVGLMTIGRADADRAAAAAAFAELRELRDRLRDGGHPELTELSMGMSGDYDVAIEQGATLLRLGTAILGPRPPRQEA